MKCLALLCIPVLLFSCTPTRSVKSSARQLINAEGFKNAHLGIAIYDPALKKDIYSYQPDKYFIPASNAKLFSLYAGLKYLKDSLPGIRYRETADSFYIIPVGDPTLLHPDFKNQRVVKKLQQVTKPLVILEPREEITPFGMGWSWDDYNSDYMSERNALPVYGNLLRWTQSAQETTQMQLAGAQQTFVFSEPDVSWKVRFIEDTSNKAFRVERKRDENYFEIHQGREAQAIQSVPFVTNGIKSALALLKDTIGHELLSSTSTVPTGFSTLYSQPVDSLYKPMLHNSDNFFAEQLLLMSAGVRFGVLSQEKMIDWLLKNDLKAVPQRPRWVDGSGLSRYNLFTPADFVWLLNKMKEEFGLEKMKNILPGAGEGTLAGYYTNHKDHIYAKTGTLSGTVALSGYLLSNKNRLLIFSVLVNNHQASSSAIRRQVEKFISGIIDKY